MLEAALQAPGRQIESAYDGLAGLARVQAAPYPENIVQAIRDQAFSYFSKPFTLQAVGAMVDQALSSSRPKDDIEVLSARPHWLELRLRCKMETADPILQFLREMGIELPQF